MFCQECLRKLRKLVETHLIFALCCSVQLAVTNCSPRSIHRTSVRGSFTLHSPPNNKRGAAAENIGVDGKNSVGPMELYRKIHDVVRPWAEFSVMKDRQPLPHRHSEGADA